MTTGLKFDPSTGKWVNTVAPPPYVWRVGRSFYYLQRDVDDLAAHDNPLLDYATKPNGDRALRQAILKYLDDEDKLTAHITDVVQAIMQKNPDDLWKRRTTLPEEEALDKLRAMQSALLKKAQERTRPHQGVPPPVPYPATRPGQQVASNDPPASPTGHLNPPLLGGNARTAPQNQFGIGGRAGFGPGTGFGPGVGPGGPGGFGFGGFGPGFNPGSGPSGFNPGMFGSGQRSGLGGGAGTGPGYAAGHGSGAGGSSGQGYSGPDPVGGFGGGGNFGSSMPGPGPGAGPAPAGDPLPSFDPGATGTQAAGAAAGQAAAQAIAESGEAAAAAPSETGDPATTQENTDPGQDEGEPDQKAIDAWNQAAADWAAQHGGNEPNPDDPEGGDAGPTIPGRGFRPHGGNTGSVPIGLPDPPSGTSGATGPFAGWTDGGGGDWGGNPHENPDPEDNESNANLTAAAVAANNANPDDLRVPNVPGGGDYGSEWGNNNPHYMPYLGPAWTPATRISTVTKASTASRVIVRAGQLRFR